MPLLGEKIRRVLAKCDRFNDAAGKRQEWNMKASHLIAKSSDKQFHLLSIEASICVTKKNTF